MIDDRQENYQKQCSKCGKIKYFSEFNKCKTNKFGLGSYCRDCVKNYNNLYYEKNNDYYNEKRRKYRLENLDECRKKDREYCVKNRKRTNEIASKSYYKRREKINEEKRKLYQENEEVRVKLNIYCRDWYKKKKVSYPIDVINKQFCILCNKELSELQIMLNQLFCSNRCFGVSQRKFGSQFKRDFRGYNWRFKRKIIRERDDYICQICGEEENGFVHDVHHIVPWHSFTDKLEANRESNLITLCNSCHGNYETSPELMIIKNKIV